MYNIKKSATMPYNSHGKSQYKKFKCALYNLLQTLLKEEKVDLPLYVPS